MHNRARLITASFLVHDLRVDWRAGARHFFDWLVDGDVANNVGNWQWVAGTGANPRRSRALNPLRQAHRFDPDGTYVRRYVPELAAIEGSAVHEPWKLREQRHRIPDSDRRSPLTCRPAFPSVSTLRTGGSLGCSVSPLSAPGSTSVRRNSKLATGPGAYGRP